jgi:stage II sporulation protein D
VNQSTEWLDQIQKSNKLPLVIILVVIGACICYHCLVPSGGAAIAGDGILRASVVLASVPAGEALKFSVESPYKIFEGNEIRPFASPAHLYSGLRLKQALIHHHSGGGMVLNGKPIPSEKVVVVPEVNGALRLNDTSYSGIFTIETRSDGTLVLCNTLGLEEYLAGVIFQEMPSAFHEEALKAQVVAARSYALQRLLSGASYLTDDTRTQMYGGLSAVTSYSRELVDATRGEVLFFEDAILPAYFSSTCGGTTARASDAFGGESPAPVDRCLVCGYCSASPYYRWRTVFPMEEVRRNLEIPASQGRFEIGITAWDSMRRAREISVMDPRKGIIKKFNADQFRRKLNGNRPLKKRILSTLIDGITFKNGALVFEGRGWGHGVGLCQYGAQGMARKGKSYKKILEYYYRDAKIVSDYGGLFSDEKGGRDPEVRPDGQGT